MANNLQSLTNATAAATGTTMTLTAVMTYHRLVAVVTGYSGPGLTGGAGIVPCWIEVSIDGGTTWTTVPNGQVDLSGNGQYHAPSPSGAVPFPALAVRARLGTVPPVAGLTVNAWIASAGT